MAEKEEPADDVAGVAVWFNKREVARVDFAAEHTLGPESDGWRIDFHDHGSIRVTMAKGPKETITVVAGDSLLSSNEDFYLTRHAGDDKRRERKGRSQAKRSTRDRGKQAPAKPPAAKRATAKGGDR